MILYFKYLKILLKAQMEYRLSFWLLLLAQSILPFSVFASVLFLFERFGSIKGWSFFEVMLCFSVIHIAFHICECFVRGFDNFAGLVTRGDFDRILVRPQGTVVQVICTEFAFGKLGRLIPVVGIFVWVLLKIPVDWDIFKALTLFFMIVSGVFIFTGIFMLAATMCFWTIQSIEVMNIFSWGGREMAQYPLNIYKKWLTRFFTFVIPFGCVNYLPLMYILGRIKGNGLLYMLTPLYGLFFIIPCLMIWRFGVRHYRSTGS